MNACQEPPASYHPAQGCNVNIMMQFGGATSRDLARHWQADQYGLSLALLHQDARLLHPSLPTFFSYVRLAACVRWGGVRTSLRGWY